jgi:hypothetical protein
MEAVATRLAICCQRCRDEVEVVTSASLRLSATEELS